MSKFPVQISVVIPTLGNRLRETRALLESLLLQTGVDDFEVLLVANLKNPKMKKMIRAFPDRFKYFHCGIRGVNRARNLGFLEAQGEVILFLDDDCYIDDRSLLLKHIELHRNFPNAIGIGGRYRQIGQRNPYEQAYFWLADHWLSKWSLTENRSLHLLGGHSSFKKSMMLRGNYLFNDQIIFGGAETELQLRLNANGETLLLFDDLFVSHDASLGIFELIKKSFYQGQGFGRRKNTGLVVSAPKKLNIQDYCPRSVLQNPKILFAFSIYDLFFSLGQANFDITINRPLALLEIFKLLMFDRSFRNRYVSILNNRPI